MYIRVVLDVTGPLFVLVFYVLFIQFRIFAPLTGQTLFGNIHFDLETWYWLGGSCMIAGYVIIVLHPVLRSVWHEYYKRTLQTSFFDNGKDLTLAEVQQNPWCPFLIFTGTVNGYKRPGESSSISEVSFTSLHMGSSRTGYFTTPPWTSLARSTALSAAACLDTLTLSMSNQLKFRFWLEMLNLSWGDYVIFQSRDEMPDFAHTCATKAGRFGRQAQWLAERTPCLALFIACQTIMNLGFHLARTGSGCEPAKSAFLAAMGLLLIMFFLSFYTFLPPFHFFAYDPLIRRFHEAVKYNYRGNSPPSLLYVTDGGVQDCTAMLQLMRRSCKRILLILAASDPYDQLDVLINAMNLAASEQIASFFDTKDPKRDLRILFAEYRQQTDWTCFKLGIRYGWQYNADAAQTGTILVVKNRLPRFSENQVCRPLLTEDVICGVGNLETDVLSYDSGLAQTLEAQLGGIGCCGCCHEFGCNCGRKFPHLSSAGYLWLTPQLFSSLCRLGHAVSAEAVRELATSSVP